MPRSNKKKKIGILTSVHHPLDGRIFYKQAISLKNAGYDVEILCYSQKDIVEECEKEKIRIFPIKRYGTSRLLRFFQLSKFISNGIHRKFGIIHIHDPELIPIAIIVKLFSRAKIIYDIHEDYPAAILSREWIPAKFRKLISVLFSRLEQFSIKYFDAIIPTTKQIASKYKHPVSVEIYNYPPQKYNKTTNATKISSQIIYIGGITRDRGIWETLAALEILKEYTDDFDVVFIGEFSDNDLEAEVKNSVSLKGLQRHISFLSKVLYNEIFGYLASASIGLLPYLKKPNHYRTLPNKLFEYMATGNVVVCNELPQYKQIVERFYCGIAVDVTKPGEYANALWKVLSDPSLCSKMSDNGFAAFNSTCNWSKEEQKLFELYDKMLT